MHESFLVFTIAADSTSTTPSPIQKGAGFSTFDMRLPSDSGSGRRPSLQSRFTEPREPIDTAPGALEPTIHVAEKNPAGIRCNSPEIAWPSRPRTQSSGTNQSLLSVGGHDRLADRAAW